MTGRVVAVVGATGAVGREFLRILETRDLGGGRLRLWASDRSAGTVLDYRGTPHRVGDLVEEDFRGVDVAFFSAGASVSREHAPRAARAGALVVDNSSAFRMDDDVPLVVPEVNGDGARPPRGIVANPNCTTILLVVVLAALERHARIRRVVCATYQAVSGSGAAALEELDAQARAEARGAEPQARVFPKPIHRNVLPFVQAFGEDAITTEEWKVIRETRRILGRPDLAVSATCVRVPVRRAHSEAVNVEFEVPVEPEEARAWLRRAPGVVVVDDPARLAFPTPREAEGRDEVLVGRIRRDPSHPRALDLWLTGDQLRKGAALNAVQVAESLLAAESTPGGRVP